MVCRMPWNANAECPYTCTGVRNSHSLSCSSVENPVSSFVSQCLRELHDWYHCSFAYRHHIMTTTQASLFPRHFSVYFFSLLHRLYLFYEDIGKPIYESCHLIQTSPFNWNFRVTTNYIFLLFVHHGPVTQCWRCKRICFHWWYLPFRVTL